MPNHFCDLACINHSEIVVSGFLTALQWVVFVLALPFMMKAIVYTVIEFQESRQAFAKHLFTRLCQSLLITAIALLFHSWCAQLASPEGYKYQRQVLLLQQAQDVLQPWRIKKRQEFYQDYQHALKIIEQQEQARCQPYDDHMIHCEKDPF